MTFHAQTQFSIPEETIRVARAAYPRGNTLLKIRDALGTRDLDQAKALTLSAQWTGSGSPMASGLHDRPPMYGRIA